MPEPIYIKDPSGNIKTIDPSEYQNAIKNWGYTPASNDEITQKQNTDYYDSPTQHNLGRLQAFSRGATAGLGDAAVGLIDPEAGKDLLARKKVFEQQHPYENFALQALGFAGSLGAGEALGGTAKLLNPTNAIIAAGKGTAKAVEGKFGSQLLGKLAGGAIEGGLLTGTNIASEKILGDPDLNAQSIASQIGMGMLLGGGITGLGETLLGGLGAAKNLKSSLFPEGIFNTASKDITVEGAQQASQFADALRAKTGVGMAPSSLEDIAAQVRGANLPTENVPLPSKDVLLDAQSNLPDLKYPAHKIQIDSLSNPATRDRYGAFIESGSKDGMALKNYEALQKNDAVTRTQNTIEGIAPSSSVTSDEVEGGQKMVKAFQDQYQAEKNELAPIFKEFDKSGINPVTYPGELVGRLENAIPGVSRYLDFEGIDGPVTLAKYDPGMPFSKNVYGAMRDLVDTVNREGVTLGEIRNLRNTIGDRINLLSAPRDSMQIVNLKSSLMDFIANEIDKVNPDIEVKDIFRRYAINEQNRGIIENILGGKIGDNVSFAKKIVPEDILKNIFSDSISVKAAKDILGNEKFSEALANYLSSQKAKFTDSARNGFSSQKFANFLKAKSPELQEAFRENPQMLNRLRSLANWMRILPDAPSPNPSGTAKTLMHYIKNPFSPADLLGGGLKAAKERFQAGKDSAVINEMLKGVSPDAAEERVNQKYIHYRVLNKMNDLIQKTGSMIERKIGQGFRLAEGANADIPVAASILAKRIVGGDKEEKQKKYQEAKNQILNLYSNPHSALDTITNTTSPIYEHAPEISRGIHSAMLNSLEFLGEKIPTAKTQTIFHKEYEPSDAEIRDFMEYHAAVEDPISVLDGLKTNSISTKQVEALQSVYPHLYDSMRTSLIKKLTELKEEPSYQKQMAIATFLGQPIDSSMNPQSILANQMNFNMQRQGITGQQDKKQKTTQTGLSKLTLANRAMNPIQQAATRAEERSA